MFALLAVPVVVAVALTHRGLQTVAPSNILIARVRATRPTLLGAGGLGALGLAMIAVAHGLTIAIAIGAPGWLNLLAVVLLWDAIKAVLVAVSVAARAMIGGVLRARRPASDRTVGS